MIWPWLGSRALLSVLWGRFIADGRLNYDKSWQREEKRGGETLAAILVSWSSASTLMLFWHLIKTSAEDDQLLRWGRRPGIQNVGADLRTVFWAPSWPLALVLLKFYFIKPKQSPACCHAMPVPSQAASFAINKAKKEGREEEEEGVEGTEGPRSVSNLSYVSNFISKSVPIVYFIL